MGRTVGGLKLGGGGGRGAWEGGSGVPKAGEDDGRTLSEAMGSLMAVRRGFLIAAGLAAMADWGSRGNMEQRRVTGGGEMVSGF
jgi:hypothetical protein